MLAVVQLKSSANVELEQGASYAAAGGVSQRSTDASAVGRLETGGSPLVYYTFAGGKLGGTMTIAIGRPGGTKRDTLNLAIR